MQSLETALLLPTSSSLVPPSPIAIDLPLSPRSAAALDGAMLPDAGLTPIPPELLPGPIVEVIDLAGDGNVMIEPPSPIVIDLIPSPIMIDLAPSPIAFDITIEPGVIAKAQAAAAVVVENGAITPSTPDSGLTALPTDFLFF
jgi:hypothetical protein